MLLRILAGRVRQNKIVFQYKLRYVFYETYLLFLDFVRSNECIYFTMIFRVFFLCILCHTEKQYCKDLKLWPNNNINIF